MSTLGQRLEKLRGKMSRKDFAKQIGVHQQSIYEYEKNRKIPTYETIKKISSRLNINPLWLNAGDGPMRPGDPAEQPMPTARPAFPSTPESAPLAACPRCAKLEAKLEKVEAQRDELAQENRQLWKENGEYRERLARYEERAIKPDMEEPDPGDRPLA